MPLETPERVGPYRILREIDEGGMGIVYEAEQERPVRRRVAVKLIKWGMDTKQVMGRFESERQALALMNHPNIASVFDAGATEQGRPFFVMEFVPGVPSVGVRIVPEITGSWFVCTVSVSRPEVKPSWSTVWIPN